MFMLTIELVSSYILTSVCNIMALNIVVVNVETLKKYSKMFVNKTHFMEIIKTFINTDENVALY